MDSTGAMNDGGVSWFGPSIDASIYRVIEWPLMMGSHFERMNHPLVTAYLLPTLYWANQTILVPLDRLMEGLSSTIGLDQSACTYMFFLIVCNFPLAYLLRKSPTGTFRTLLILLIGLFYSFYTFGAKALHSILVPFVVYVWLFVCSLGPIKRKLFSNHSRLRLVVPIVPFVFCFLYLLTCHYHRMLIDYLGWKLDFTGLQMLITLKVVSVCWNLHDGILYQTLDLHKPSDVAVDEKKKEQTLLNASVHIPNRLERLPNLLEYFSYLFFFIPVLSGPVYEMADFMRFIYGEYESDISFINQPNHKPSKDQTPAIPWSHIGKNLLLVLYNMILVLKVEPLFTRERLEDVIFERNGQELLFGSAALYKYAFAWAAIYSLRFKYHVGWHLTESALIIAGFGYQKQRNGTFDFSGANAIDFFSFEFSSNLRDVTTYWNVSVSKWLRNYVYTRVGRTAGTMSTVVTFLVSAVWHGTYAGYLIMWLHYAIVLQFIGRLAHRKIRPWFLNDVEHTFSSKNSTVMSYLYKIASLVGTSIFTTYLLPPFLLLSGSNALQYYSSLNWFGHFALVPIYLILTLIPYPKSRHPHSEKKNE